MLIATTALNYGQQSQRAQLQFEDISDPLAVWAENGAAAVVIVCDDRIKLTFDSDVGAVSVNNSELKGGDMYYTLRFQVGANNNRRNFNIRGVYNITSEIDRIVYEPIRFAIELQPKEMKTFYLSDPNIDVFGGCYGRTSKEALDAFRRGYYPEAKLKYLQVMECLDTPAAAFDEIDRRIADIDTIIHLRNRADIFYITGDYRRAYDNYLSAFAHNPDDRYVELRMNESRSRMTGENTSVKNPKLSEKKIERRRQRTFAMMYTPPMFGSIGWYRDKKVGIYFGMSEAYFTDDFYDFAISTGLTFRLFRMTGKNYRKPVGVWMELGVGYNEVFYNNNYYYPYDENYVQFAPEIGTLLKLGFLAFRYSYHYRYDFPFNVRGGNFVGLGICF